VALIPATVAAELVERSLGVSWGKAQKDLLDGCANGKLKYQNNPNGPDVSDVDLRLWLDQQTAKPQLGKQPLIIKHLTEMFPDCKVPDHRQRKGLLAELRNRDPVLNSLDHKTLTRAINTYNSSR
jgi:hypothetical protein